MKILMKKDGKWWTGHVRHNEDGTYDVFNVVHVPGKASDLKKGFATLNHFSLRGGLKEDVLGFLIAYEAQQPGVEKVYAQIPNIPITTVSDTGKVKATRRNTEISEEDWEKWYWGDFNKICKACKKDCKQSHMAKVIRCAQFKKASTV